MRKTLITSVVLLAGCMSAPTRPQHQEAWYKTGATEQQFNMTSARCRMAALNMPVAPYAGNPNTASGNLQNAGMDIQNAALLGIYFYNCMVAEGWVSR